MPRVTPAFIEYSTTSTSSREATEQELADGEDANISTTSTSSNYIKFHTVIAEDHQASAVVTKFPVQSGFDISNHSIRQNRVITLDAMITNTLLSGTKQKSYGANNSQHIFNLVESLVNSATQCTVTTNLGIYKPVVFNSFKTKQEQGMTDAIRIILVGEEVQVKNTVSKTSPKSISFSSISDVLRTSVIDDLVASGIGTIEGLADSVISQGTAILGDSFKFVTELTSGATSELSFLSEVTNGAKDFIYNVDTANTGVFSEISHSLGGVISDLNIPLLANPIDLIGGFSGVTNCLVKGSTSVLGSFIDDKVDTAMGSLESSIYGARQDILKLGDNDAMQSLLGTSMDCIAMGASKTLGGEATNTQGFTDQILSNIKSVGNVITDPLLGRKSITLTKISTNKVLPLKNTTNRINI